MDRNKDYRKFAILMAVVAEAVAGPKPSPEKIEIFFRALGDMDYTTVHANTMRHLRYNKFFPTIPELRREKSPEIKAHEDFAIIEGLLKNFVFPGFVASGMNVVEMKLKEMNKEHLLSLVHRWGAEIVNATNPTATRAQFIKSYQAEEGLLKRSQLSGTSGYDKMPENVKKYLKLAEDDHV